MYFTILYVLTKRITPNNSLWMDNQREDSRGIIKNVGGRVEG